MSRQLRYLTGFLTLLALTGHGARAGSLPPDFRALTPAQQKAVQYNARLLTGRTCMEYGTQQKRIEHDTTPEIREKALQFTYSMMMTLYQKMGLQPTKARYTPGVGGEVYLTDRQGGAYLMVTTVKNSDGWYSAAFACTLK